MTGKCLTAMTRTITGAARATAGQSTALGTAPSLVVPGDEDNCMIGVAMGDRQACISEPPETCGNAGYDAKCNSGVCQGHGFFATTTKHVRVTALQPQDALALTRQFDQANGDIGLLGRGLATALAGMNAGDMGGGERQNFGGYQRVVNNHVGLPQSVPTQQGQQARPSGS